MTAFLTKAQLRAHDAPALLQALYDHAGEPALTQLVPIPRPALTARWLVTPDGRLSCRWQSRTPMRFAPPPH